MTANPPMPSVNDAERRLATTLAQLDRFWDIFERRPGMLGTPRDLEAMFFHIDQIEYLLRGGDLDAYRQVCWNEFLIERNHIRGGANLFRESLSDDLDDFPRLQAVRRDFLTWRAARDEWRQLSSP
jgi:hypothetical protein